MKEPDIKANESAPVCPACNRRNAIRFKEQPEDFEYGVLPEQTLQVYHCADCGTLFLFPRPSDKMIASFYPEDYYAFSNSFSQFDEMLYRQKIRGRHTLFTKLANRKTIRLFDIGAADGHFFDVLYLFGQYQFFGVEMNAQAAHKAQLKGYCVSEQTFEDYSDTSLSGTMDIVTMNHLLEHVPDPGRVLDKARDLLRPGGWVVGHLPQVNSIDHRIFKRFWGGYHYPRHLQLFTQSSLRQMIVNHGFSKGHIKSDLNTMAALSLQNYLSGQLNLSLDIWQGSSRLMPLFMILTMPFCIGEFLVNRGGCMIFLAQR